MYKEDVVNFPQVPTLIGIRLFKVQFPSGSGIKHTFWMTWSL